MKFEPLSQIGATVLTLTLVSSLVLPLASANAQNRPDRVEEKLQQAREKQMQVKERIQQVTVGQASKSAELKLRLAANQERIEEKLAGVKLETCQNRQEKIAQRTAKTTERAENILHKMESIATKAEDFQTAKGISTDDLTNLKSEMDSSKQAVEAALEAATISSHEFDCESDGPKAQLQLFVSAMDIVRESLKSYKSAIHDYVKAIRHANGLHRDEEASSSATPTPESTTSTEEAE